MSKLKKLAISLLSACVLFACVGCGGGSQTPTGFTSIQFRASVNEFSSAQYTELYKTYNETQGKEDKVYVTLMPSGADYSANLSSTLAGKVNRSQVMLINDQYFKNYAAQNYFVNLEEYLNDESTLTKDDSGNNILDLSDIPSGLVDRYRIDVETRLSGAGTDLYGIPNGNDPEVFFYNPQLLTEAGMNIISVSEEELGAYNAANGTEFMPHGYAEYAQAPAQGMTASQNLAGETVYKVFNDLIPMNWEELVCFSKYFTPEYAGSATPSGSMFGFVSEWWFFLGWSVGGDCIGYDEEAGQYKFTLGDENPNYLVTKDGTVVNQTTYDSGDLLSYADRTYVANNQSAFTTMIGEGTLYAMPSTYDAFKFFCSLSMATNEEVDNGENGLGISPSPEDLTNTSYGSYFKAGSVAIVNLGYADHVNFKSTKLESFGACPSAQYREYVGGSVDSEGNLKIIGRDYDGQTYTGELKTVNDAQVVGRNCTGSIAYAFVIPKNSGDETKYMAAWKFIQWAAGPEGQAILAESNTMMPNQIDYALSDEFTERDSTDCDNLLAVSMMCRDTEQGDWSYLEDGEWVNVWADTLNTSVRNGSITLSEFFDLITDSTNESLASDKYKIVITTK